MKIMVLLWSTSVEKDSSIVPSLFFSHFFGPSLFMAFLLFFIPHLGQCSRKWWSSHFYLFTTQWLQLDTRTKYDSIWMPPVVYRDMQWTKSDMYEKLWTVALPQIWCQLHDHAKQYDNDEACHNKRNGGKLHGNISWNGYGNAIIGRYGGCFEEGIWWVYGTGESCVVLERLAMAEMWECV